MSLQIIAEQLRQVVQIAGPVALISGAIIVTWVLSRFIARYQIQRDILRYLPQVVRDELTRRDAELKGIRAELVAAAETVTEYRVRLRAAAVMAHKVGEILLPTPQEVEVRLQLVDPQVKRR